MSDPFLAEIRIVPYNFAPLGWAFCDGQLLPISQNTALFSLLGTTYGGDGRTTFALPNLQGAAPLHAGQGPGLTDHPLGSAGGSAAVTLVASQMPEHTHVAMADLAGVRGVQPGDATWAPPGVGRGLTLYNPELGAGQGMAVDALIPAGGGQPHNNLPPYLTLNFIIALQGVYPSRP